MVEAELTLGLDVLWTSIEDVRFLDSLSFLVAGLQGDKCMADWEQLKNMGRASYTLNVETTLHIVSIINFSQFSQPYKLNRENKTTEVLTLEMNCFFVFFLLYPMISHYWHCSHQWLLHFSQMPLGKVWIHFFVLWEEQAIFGLSNHSGGQPV